MARIFYIHGVNARRELGHMFEGAPHSGESEDRVRAKYQQHEDALREKLSKAAREAGIQDPQIIPIYWGDLGARIRYYSKNDSGMLVPSVQDGVARKPMRPLSPRERVQGTARPNLDAAEQDILARLETLAALLDQPEPTLLDVVLAQPQAALEALFATPEADSLPGGAEGQSRRIAVLARRVDEDTQLRAALAAVAKQPQDADRELLTRLWRELEGGERTQGSNNLLKRAMGAVMSGFLVKIAKSRETYEHASRFVGDTLIYFSQRGTREAPGPIASRVLGELRDALREPDGTPTIVITHSLGCTVFYDLFTYFDPALRFDLWVSVGSQLSIYEELNMLANHATRPRSTRSAPGLAPGRPGLVPVALPPGAAWYNVVDPRDPLANFASKVFAGVTDVPYQCRTQQLWEIHNAYLSDPEMIERIKKWLEELVKRGSSQKTR